MSILDGLRELFSLAQVQPLHERHENHLAQAQIEGFPTRYPRNTWRVASSRDALGVPAVFRATSLIANSVGQLSLEAYRNGRKLAPIDTPRVVLRPDPFTTPRVFHRNTAWYLCSKGEAWWWIAKRDTDEAALSVLAIDPREIVVEQNPRNVLRPVIRWGDRVMPNDDMVQLTLMPDPNNPLRGWGPLQACGAAVSVAVEAQEWAATFFAGGGVPPVVIKTALELEDDDIEDLRKDWMSKTGNTPRVIDPRIDSVNFPGVNPEGAQLTEARDFQVGEVARMFGIPGPLLEFNAAGSSLHYQNDESIWSQFLGSCLGPNYLEPIEQHFTDLLTRSTVVEFNRALLLRASVKTRFEVYGIGIDKGIISAEEARVAEGYDPGNVDTRPVPFAPPAALPSPSAIPQLRSAPVEVRCEGTRLIRGRMMTCNHKFGMASPPYRFDCPKCGTAAAA